MKTARSKDACPLSPARGSIPLHRAGREDVKGGKRILVIDDSRVVLKVTAYKLRAYGYEVHTAEDGATAISKLREVRPDLLLLDLNFPPDVAHGGGVPWDGLMLLSWLRRMNEAQGIPVIAITAGELPGYKQRCQEAGVLDIFLKPLDHEALAAAIAKALADTPHRQEPAKRTTDPAPQSQPQPNGRKAEPESQTAAQPRDERQAESTTPKRILFVDDESDWRYMGALYLTECGYKVVATADAVGALVQVSTFKPQLIILDLNLGGQSGVTLLKLLAEAHSNVPVLIYTGTELDDVAVANLAEQGATDCLRKGTMDELINAVAKILGGRPVKGAVLGKATPDHGAPTAVKEERVPESLTVAEQVVDAGPEQTETVPEQQIRDPGTAGGPPREPVGPQLTAVEEALETSPEEPRPALEASEKPAPEVVEAGKASVLIVSEDAELSDTLRSALESQPFSVADVVDGTEALNQLRTTDVDLILFDMAPARLPVDRFYAALEASTPHLCRRTIFITSDEAPPKADGFVRKVRGLSLWKPFPLAELLEAAQTIRDRNAPAPSDGRTLHQSTVEA